MAKSAHETAHHITQRISAFRKSIYSIIAILVIFLAIEVTARITAFAIYDFSPYFLVYGFTDAYVDHAEGHTSTFKGYFKFPPSRTLKQYGMFKQPTEIRINNLGFRGDDFDPTKPPGAVRVVCMGASSTFGFYDRDEYTYPVLLEKALRARLQSESIEVINAGIPHMNSDNILAMLEGEVLSYQPDVVTFYEAFNDAGRVMDENHVQAMARWAHSHFATYVGLKRMLEALGGPKLHSKWAEYLPKADQKYIAKQIDLHVPGFEKNIQRFIHLVRTAGAEPVLIRQPMTTRFSPNSAASQVDGGIDYERELSLIRQSLDERGFVDSIEVLMLVHAALLDTLDRVSDELGVRVVDNVAVVGDDADQLASYVHLSEDANGRLAEVLAEEIAGIVKTRGPHRWPAGA
jgi:lysophospholipase L1-like esterase